MRREIRNSLSLLLTGVLILGGCAQSVEEAPVDQVIETPEASASVEDVPRHPLTGFEVQEGSITGPSIAVKIDNTSSGRPQVGIASADLVFEELVEGGVTRYLAVFHTAVPSEVGPVRSGRPQDADLVRALGGVFVFSGVGNANVREIIKASGLHLVEHDTSSGTPDGQYFFRSNRKPAPWNLHIEASDLIANYSNLEAPQTQFTFVSDVMETTAVQAGEVAESVRVVFSSGVDSIWQWDESSGVYLKFLSNGSPDTDADGTQISATNVVVLNPNYVDIEGLPSAKIAGLIEDAYVASGGKYVRGTFDAMALGEPIKLLDGEGNPIRLAPGKTFVLLPPGPGSTASGVSAGSISFQ